MSRLVMPKGDKGQALTAMAFIAGSTLLVCAAYLVEQVFGDGVYILTLGVASTGGLHIGRAAKRNQWLPATFAAIAVVMIYNQISLAAVTFLRLEVMHWNPSLFRDFAMIINLVGFMAAVLAAVFGSISAACHAPDDADKFPSAFAAPMLVAVVALAACLAGSAEAFALRTSSMGGLMLGAVWVGIVLFAAWALGRCIRHHARVLAFLAGAGLAQVLFSLHRFFLFPLWYEAYGQRFLRSMGGGAVFDPSVLLGLVLVAGMTSALSTRAQRA